MQKNDMKHTLLHTFLLSALGMAATTVQAATVITDAEMTQYTAPANWTRGSVHDPSVVITTDANGKELFYVFGSHMGVAKTSDLRNWTSVTSESTSSPLFGDADGKQCSYTSAFTRNQVTKVTNYAGKSVSWGTFNASAYNTAIDNFTVQGNMWAPDVIYNTAMKKWCMYLSLNGSKWNSVIIMLSADHIEGPYIYQGPVVYSGFNVTTNAATDYTKTDLQIALGSLSSLPSRYNVGNQWGTYWPHAIDPGVFYDANGDLWMNYGSWSGGIYMLKLDKNTGLRDYTHTYSSDYDSQKASVTSDPYFGKKIAGGYYVSGEGSYIEKIGNYYYLFLSYGFYAPDGGYEMRIFRSSTPDGNYVDETGTDAKYTKYMMNYGTNATTNKGMKLMGGYQWPTMGVAEIAQGHNSACVDAKGRAFVVYHTKFNDGTAGHQLRVHQLFVNADGWITAAPYEYNGEEASATEAATKASFSKAEIAGTYQFLIHNYKVDYASKAYSKPISLTLGTDGKITGDQTGTWSLTSGTGYITLLINGVGYHGVVVPQSEGGSNFPAIGITAMSPSYGTNIWGEKLSDKGIIAKDYAELGKKLSEGDLVYADLDLTATVGSHGSSIKWTSNDPAVFTNTGAIITPARDTSVSATLTMASGDCSYSRTISFTVKGGGLSGADYATGLMAYYNFNNNLINQYFPSSVGTAGALTSGTNPGYEANSTLGNTVWHQYFGYADAQTTSYTSFSNPLSGQKLTGATVSMWVYRLDSDAWDALWSFCSGTFSNITGRLFLTGNTYLGYNGPDGWFDCNSPSSSSTSSSIIPPSTWTLVTISFSSKGFSIYTNGKLAASESDCESFTSGNGFSSYQAVLDQMSSASNFYLGYGSFWGSAPALFDDLLIYNRALSGADVAKLYRAETNGASFLPGQIATVADTATLTKHGVGSSSQTIKKDSSLVSFYYSFSHAQSVVVSGLPSGISYVVDNTAHTVTFGGTATADAGSYTYTITTTGGEVNISKSGSITIVKNGSTGIASQQAETDGLLIYPNPAGSQTSLNLATEVDGTACIQILNAQGIMVMEQKWQLRQGLNTRLLELNLAKGVYMVVINGIGKQYKQRLVVR